MPARRELCRGSSSTGSCGQSRPSCGTWAHGGDDVEGGGGGGDGGVTADLRAAVRGGGLSVINASHIGHDVNERQPRAAASRDDYKRTRNTRNHRSTLRMSSSYARAAARVGV